MYHTGDKRFAPAVPYASIIVELDDAPGALLAGNLLEAPYTEAKVGRRVEVDLRKAERRHHAAAVSSRAHDRPRNSGAETPCGRTDARWRVSGVGFSKVSRSAEIPLAAHALTAVKEAVADSGLQMSDIDGLATYPELPATGHAEVDGISVVSVNCMMAMLKLPNLTWHIQVGTTNIGGAVQQAVNALLAGVCKYAVVWRAMHNPRGTYQNLPGGLRAGRRAVHRALRLRRSGAGHGGRLYALARTAQPEPREDGDPGGDAAPPHAAQSARLFLRHAADARGLLRVADGGVSVLPVRLRHPGAGGGRDRADDRRPGARPEAARRPISPATASGCTSRWRAASAASPTTWRAAAARRS